MNLKELRQEIEFLKAEEDQAVTHLVGATARDKLQGIKQTVEAVDKFMKYVFDDFRDNNNTIEERNEWNNIKELLDLK